VSITLAATTRTVIFLPPEARFGELMEYPENARLLKELLKTFCTIPLDLEGDSFGKIYEYFLAEFA
jgi:hypothetical protein